MNLLQLLFLVAQNRPYRCVQGCSRTCQRGGTRFYKFPLPIFAGLSAFSNCTIKRVRIKAVPFLRWRCVRRVRGEPVRLLRPRRYQRQMQLDFRLSKGGKERGRGGAGN